MQELDQVRHSGSPSSPVVPQGACSAHQLEGLVVVAEVGLPGSMAVAEAVFVTSETWDCSFLECEDAAGEGAASAGSAGGT